MGQLFLLFKFGKKEHLEKLQKGKIRYMSANYYNAVEKETGDTSIGDANDSKDKARGLYYYFIDKSGSIISEGKNLDMTIENKELLKCPIFCCTVIEIKEDTKPIECKEFFKDFFDKDYWSHCLLINGSKFIRQFRIACNNQNIIYDDDKVKYYNPAKPPKEKEDELERDFSRISFWKDETRYKGQHEYRFLLKNKRIENKEDEYVQDIGDISTYSNLVSTDELKNMIIKLEFDK